MRLPRRRRLQKCPLDLGLVDVSHQDRRNGAHDLVLNDEDIVELPVVALCPAMGSSHSVDELGIDAHTVTTPANAAFQHIAHAQFAPDLPHVDRLALVLEARVSGDDEQLREPRQLGDDVIGHAVGEIFLLGVAAHVGEGQNSD